MEDGSVTLIASTTENPYFYIYNALLSRCTVFEFKSLTAADVEPGLGNALQKLDGSRGACPWKCDEDAWSVSGGERAGAICARRWAAWSLPSRRPPVEETGKRRSRWT